MIHFRTLCWFKFELASYECVSTGDRLYISYPFKLYMWKKIERITYYKFFRIRLTKV